MWYLKARKVLVSTLKFEELRCARAVFVKRRHGKLVALLTLHVDDGMLFGDVNSKEYQVIKEDINKNFKVKHWKAGMSNLWNILASTGTSTTSSSR